MVEPRQAQKRIRCGLFYGILALLILMVPALLLGSWWMKWREYRDAATQVSERLSRYQILLESEGELREQLAQLRRQLERRGYFIRAGSAELAAARMQQTVKTAVQSAGGTLVSTRNEVGEPEGRFRHIVIRVRMKGDVEALARTLVALQNSQPVVMVEDLVVRSRRTVSGHRRNRVEGYILDAGFKVVGYLMEVRS